MHDVKARGESATELAIERLGLGKGTWKPVEEHAMIGVVRPHALDDHGDDQAIGHQRAAVHIVPGRAAEFRAAGAVRAEQVAAGDVGYTVLRHDAACLGAFASSDGSKQDKVEGRHCSLESISGQ